MNDTPLPEPSADRLDQHLAHLRRETETFNTPDGVATHLMAAYAKRHRQPGRLAMLAQWLAPALGLAASLGVAAWIVFMPSTSHKADTAPGSASASADDDSSPFIALQSLDRISRETSPQLIETRVPRVMLASLGVPVNPEVAGDSIRAQMLVSASGQPLAMRLAQ
jgi:hypothetical protein